MRYVNKRTGAVIDTVCEVAGGDWEEIGPVTRPAAPAQKKQPAKKVPAKRTRK